MTDKIDESGHFILEKHVVVTITLTEVTHVALNEFNLDGIIGSSEISKIDDVYQFEWEGSYGVEGSIRAKPASISPTPGRP
jgi:hypothetical protein